MYEPNFQLSTTKTMPHKRSATDDLSRRLSQGDRDALAELFTAYRDRLGQMLHFRTPARLAGRLDIDDLIQESYLAAERRIDAFEHTDQDVRFGVPHVLRQSDAAVDDQAAATDRLLSRYADPADVVLAAVVALRPQAIEFGVLEEIRASLRMVSGREGVGHGQRIFEVNVLAKRQAGVTSIPSRWFLVTTFLLEDRFFIHCRHRICCLLDFREGLQNLLANVGRQATCDGG